MLEGFELVVGLLLLDHLGQLLNVVVLERLHATQHHVQDNSSTPNVDFVGVRLTCEHLWGTELNNARIRLHDLFLWIMLPCHVKVNNEHVIVTLTNK